MIVLLSIVSAVAIVAAILGFARAARFAETAHRVSTEREALQSELTAARGRAGIVLALAPSTTEILEKTTALSGGLRDQESAIFETRAATADALGGLAGVADTTQELSRSVGESSAAIEEMVASIQLVSGNIGGLAGTVEGVSAKIVSLARSIEQVAGNAQNANTLSMQADTKARDGGKAVEELVTSTRAIADDISAVVREMEELGAASERIGNIVEVIDSIADQTNLLALNAAIEAARAGEHGRGFAVVADEVRKLAENSARSTKEISQLIKNIQAKTAEVVRSTTASGARASAGLAMADRAGRAIDDILGAVSQATGLIDQISTAAREQAAGSNAIVASVDEMNSLTAEAARSLAEQNTSNQAMMFTIDAMREIAERVSSAVAMQRQACDRIEAAAMLLGASTETGRVATEGIESIAGAMHAHIHAPPTVAPRSNVEDDRLSLGRAR